MAEETKKNAIVAGALCFLFGVFGIHRFYVGKTKTAVAMLLITLLLGVIGGIIVTLVWAIVDFLQICLGNFKTESGQDLVR